VDEGLRIARESGAVWLQTDLESLARRARLAPLSQDDSAEADDAVARLGLTDRELGVLELLTRGMTNAQIGEELFITEKTASAHVSRILAKLHVRTRVEAATTAQRLGVGADHAQN
jgi:DNA-binding NarL/FixJ family response regulator